MYVHGNNLIQKEKHRTKYLDADSKKYLKEIRIMYDKWKKDNEGLIGPTKKISDKEDRETISKRVSLLNDYKDFLDQQHYAEKFDSRSNLHSSVLEEFLFYLFKDLVGSISENALIGKSHSFKDIFFKSANYSEMVSAPNALIEIKDHGPGIPKENLGKIFERFYTYRPEEKSFGNNSGLGLSICKQIIKSLNGTIIATNRLEGGSVFTVTLPLNKDRKRKK